MSVVYKQAEQEEIETLRLMAGALSMAPYLTKSDTFGNGIYHTVGLAKEHQVELFMGLKGPDGNEMRGPITLLQSMANLLLESDKDLVEGYTEDYLRFGLMQRGVHLLKIDPSVIPVIAPIINAFTDSAYTAFQVVIPDQAGLFPWESGNEVLNDKEVVQHIIKPPSSTFN